MADTPEKKRDQPQAPEGMTPEDAAARLNEILSSPIENPFVSEDSPSGSHAPTKMPQPKAPQPPGPREDVTPEPMPPDPAAATREPMRHDPAPATAAPERTPSVSPEFAAWEGARTIPGTAAKLAPATSAEPMHAAERETASAKASEATRAVSEPAPPREAAPPDREGLRALIKVPRPPAVP